VNVAIPFSLISAAEINLTASLAAILNSTTVMFTAMVAAVWIGDALTARKFVGLVLGIVGVTVLVGWDPVAMNWVVVLSVGAMLAASLSYALGAVYAKRTFAGSPPLAIAIGQLTAASMLVLPLAAVSVPGRPSTTVVLSVLALALLSTAVAYMLYFRLIENVGPTSTSTVTLLVPLFGLLFGVVLLDEPVGLGTFAGLALILSSVALIAGLGVARQKPRV
jgi:drug/metabolite transporter (DMT)-like permease